MATENKFRSVSLFSISPSEPLPFHLYVFFKKRHLNYLKPGQRFNVDVYNIFIYKRIHRVFLPEEDFVKYEEYQKRKAKENDELLNSPALSKDQREANKVILEVKKTADAMFFNEDESSLEKEVRDAIQVSKKTVEMILAKPYIQIYNNISAKAHTVANHSMRVSVLATFLSYQLGFSNPEMLEQLAIAGLLHDIGKTRLNLSDPMEQNETSAASDAEIMMHHPTVSCDILSRLNVVPQEVIRIIREHHEARDGSGYPNHIRGTKITGASKIFAMANMFDDLSSRAEGNQPEAQRAALKAMMTTHREKFDSNLLAKVASIILKRSTVKTY